MAYSNIQSSRNPSRFYGRAHNSRDRSAACTTRKVPYSTQVGKERVHRREFFRSVNVTSVALKLYNLGTDPRKKPCNKNDAPAEMHGKWRNMFAISKKRTKSRCSRLQKFGHYQHHLRRIPKREQICGGFQSINVHEQERLEPRYAATVVTASGEVQTNEEATAYVHDLELFVTVQIIEDTLAVLSPGNSANHLSGPMVKNHTFFRGQKKPSATR